MKYSYLKLTFFFFQCITFSAYSHNKLAADTNSVLSQYNSWLQLTGLNKILVASDFSSQLEIVPFTAIKRTVTKYTLTLQPAKEYTDPQRFATAWNLLTKKMRSDGADIYSLLFNKLADYAFEPQGSLVLNVYATNADIFSLTVYYDQTIKHQENLTLERGGNNHPGDLALISADVGSIIPGLDFMKDECFNTGKRYSLEAICSILHAYFIKYPSGPGGIKTDSIFNDHRASVTYRIANISGVVTHTKLHEVIILRVTPDASGICYNIDAGYSGGSTAPDPDYYASAYREAALKYKPEYDIYKQKKLNGDLKQIFHAQ